MVLLGTAAVLLSAAALSFSGFAEGIRLHRAAWEVGSRLNYARYKALAEGDPMRVRFTAGGYAVERYNPESQAWTPDRTGSFESVAVSANNTPMFHPSGTVSHMATITLDNRRGRYRITIAITGRIKVVRE